MIRMQPLVALCLLLALPGPALSDDNQAHHSYESCSLITSEYLTVLQLASRGLQGDTLKETLPGISKEAARRVDALLAMAREDGLIDTYSIINSEYAKCARDVFREMGVPPEGSREAHFYHCAGENKVRYEIALATLVGASMAEVIPQLRARHQPVARAIYELHHAEGELAVFDSLATELKHCLNNKI